MTVIKPIKVGAFGLDDRARKLLGLFFAGPCKGRFTLVSQFQADVLIVDLDRPSGWSYYQTQNAINPSRPLVAISLYRNREMEVEFFIKKPMRLDTVLQVLERAGAQVQGASLPPTPKSEEKPSKPRVSSSQKAESTEPPDERPDASEEYQFLQLLQRRPKADLAQIKAAAELFYDPEKCIQGHLQKTIQLARAEKQGMQISGFWGRLYLDPLEERAYSELLDTRLRPLTVMRIPRREIDITPLEADALQKLRGGNKAIKIITSIDALLWHLSLWSSRGRLPKGTDIESPVFLRRWPNFTRFLETPNAMRIIALWARQPASLTDTLEALNVSQAETFALFSAALAVDCVGIGRRQADSLLSPVPLEPAPQRGLFKRTLNRLFRHEEKG